MNKFLKLFFLVFSVIGTAQATRRGRRLSGQAAECGATAQERQAQENKRAVIAQFFQAYGVPAHPNDRVSPLVAGYARDKTLHEIQEEKRQKEESQKRYSHYRW